MIRSTTFINNICGNASAMSFAGLNNYTANAMIDDINWMTGVSDSDYIDYVLNGKVPVMTSNTTPEGVVSHGVQASGNASRAYLLFDNDLTTYNSQYTGQSQSSVNLGIIWSQYQFLKKVKVKAFRMMLQYGNVSAFKIQGSDDGSNFTDVQSFTGTTYGTNTMYKIVVRNEYDLEFYYWRYQTTGGYAPVFYEIQFYYREDY